MTNDFTFYLPVKILFGAGKFDMAGEEAANLGKKALIVTGRRSAEKSGLLTGLTELLKRNNIEWTHFNGVAPNPTDLIVDTGAELARRENCDFVIGLGGGSVIDTAKSIALSAKSALPIWRHVAFWESDYVVPEDALPIMAIETLAGTGTESDNIAVLTNEKTGEKPGYTSRLLFPKVSIVDPELMVQVPAGMTAITGFDILCHTFEGYVSRIANPISSVLNLKAIELVKKYLPAAVRDGKNMEARTNLAFANILAGFSLTHCRATLLHAMEHPVSGHFNVTHAEGLAALMPEWLKFSWAGNVEAFKDVGRIFGLPEDENTEDNLILKIKEFLKGIGLDVTLSGLGVNRDGFGELADESLRYMGGGVSNNPVTATKEQIVLLLNRSM